MPGISSPQKSVRLWASTPANELGTGTFYRETLRFWLTLRPSVDLPQKLRRFIRTPRMSLTECSSTCLRRTDRRDSKPGWFEKPSSWKEIHAALRPDEVVLEYVLTEPNSYCIWVSKKRAGVQILPAGRRRIEEMTQEYLNAIRAKRDDL